MHGYRSMQKINVFWFRRDLRLEDNTGLYYALQDDLPVLPVFVFDKNILDKLEDKSDARVTFIHQQVMHMDSRLRKMGLAGIKTYHGTPMEAYKKLVDEFEVSAVFANRDYEPYAEERDKEVQFFLDQNDVKFFTFKDQVIFEKGEILNDQGDPYKVYTPYKNKWLDKFHHQKCEQFDSENFLTKILKEEAVNPHSLEEIGFSKSDIRFPEVQFDKNVIEAYAKERDFPAEEGTTRLGVHFRFGTVSIREAVLYAMDHSETWLSELIWREFYMMILAHYPQVVDASFKSKYDKIPWRNDEVEFQKWCEGKTGYPIVDAGIRELNNTGYMHNRVRMVVASFLTKHLLIDWRWGEAYFASKLLDFELASNNGGWQWAAGTGTDAQPYFRVFNPYSQQEKFDPKLKYIKKWIPELESDEYPKPIVDHKLARQRAIDTYKGAIN